MQSDFKKQPEGLKFLDLDPEDKRNLVGFFALLMKVDKRVNKNLYKSK